MNEQDEYGPMITDIISRLSKGEDANSIVESLRELYGFGHHTASRLVEKCYTILMDDEEASVLDIDEKLLVK